MRDMATLFPEDLTTSGTGTCLSFEVRLNLGDHVEGLNEVNDGMVGR